MYCLVLTLIQKTHFQSQIAHPEEYRCPKARTIAYSKSTKIYNYPVKPEHVVDEK
jgi:hypothetical protein